jgi:hypothetical protein
MSLDDPALLDRLAALFDQHDPVPAGVAAMAEHAGRWVWRARSWSELPLVADGESGRVRGGGQLLGFASAAGRVDVEVSEDGPGSVRLTGLFSGSSVSSGSVWVRWPTGERRLDVDELGRFTQNGLPAGPLSVVVRRPGEPDAAGPWFVG